MNPRNVVRKELENMYGDKKKAQTVENAIYEWSSDDSIFGNDEMYCSNAYEMIGILKDGFDLDVCLADMKAGKKGWGLSYYNRGEFGREKKDASDEKKKEAYVYFCKAKGCNGGCGVESRQTRSGDEGMTNYAVCEKCKYEYVIRI